MLALVGKKKGGFRDKEPKQSVLKFAFMSMPKLSVRGISHLV